MSSGSKPSTNRFTKSPRSPMACNGSHWIFRLALPARHFFTRCSTNYEVHPTPNHWLNRSATSSIPRLSTNEPTTTKHLSLPFAAHDSIATTHRRQRRLFPLGNQLGSGGEGAVFSCANAPNIAVKVYHPQRRSPGLFEKLTAMIAQANPKLVAVATWPTGLLLDARSGQPVGFSMPRLSGYEEIWRLYHPVERLKFFPRAGWKFQVRTAYNLAAAFDEVHRSGCVIGDVQLRECPQCASQTLVRLVDCDSFQITANGKQYLCEVGLPHYIPRSCKGNRCED